MIPTTCPNCQSEVKEKSGISKKTGKPYKFTGCTNYPACNWIYREPYDGPPGERVVNGDLKTEVLKRIDAFREEVAQL
jgi:hypothetical protein